MNITNDQVLLAQHVSIQNSKVPIAQVADVRW
jgi:hypothetical protein